MCFFKNYRGKASSFQLLDVKQKFFDVKRRFNVFLDRKTTGREVLYSKYGKISPCWKTLSLDFNLDGDDEGQIIIDAQGGENGDSDVTYSQYFLNNPGLFGLPDNGFLSMMNYIAIRRIEFKKCQLEVVVES